MHTDSASQPPWNGLHDWLDAANFSYYLQHAFDPLLQSTEDNHDDPAGSRDSGSTQL